MWGWSPAATRGGEAAAARWQRQAAQRPRSRRRPVRGPAASWRHSIPDPSPLLIHGSPEREAERIAKQRVSLVPQGACSREAPPCVPVHAPPFLPRCRCFRRFRRPRCRLPELVRGRVRAGGAPQAGGQGARGAGAGATGDAAPQHQGADAGRRQATEPAHGARRSQLPPHPLRRAGQARRQGRGAVPRRPGGRAAAPRRASCVRWEGARVSPQTSPLPGPTHSPCCFCCRLRARRPSTSRR